MIQTLFPPLYALKIFFIFQTASTPLVLHLYTCCSRFNFLIRKAHDGSSNDGNWLVYNDPTLLWLPE